MSRKSTKFTVFICNIVISVLCVLAIVSYFFLPFWKVDLSMNISAETLTELIQPEQSEGEGTGEGEEETPEMDFSEVVGEEGVNISLSITLQTADVLSALNGEAKEVVDTILNENVDKIVDQLNEPMNKMMKGAMKTVVKTTVSELLKDYIKDAYTDEKTAEEIQEIMNDAGLDEEYIDSKTEELFNALYEENATVDSVSDKAVEIIEDAFSKMDESDSSADFTLSEEDKAKVKDEVAEVLANIAAEDGTIDMENLIADMLLKMIQGEEGGEEGSEEGSASVEKLAVALSDAPENTENSDEDSVEKLKATLRESIMDLIDEETAQTIAKVLQIISYVILFTFFTWAYLILKIIVKLGAKNNAIKLKLPIWLGSIPFWVLYLLPTVALSLLKNPPASMADMFGAEMTTAMASFDISFFTCAWVSFIIGVVLCLFSIFFYGRKRKILKKYKKGILKDEAPAFNDAEMEIEKDVLDE